MGEAAVVALMGSRALRYRAGAAALAIVASGQIAAQSTPIRGIACGAGSVSTPGSATAAVGAVAPRTAPPALRWRGADVRWAVWPVTLGTDKVRNRIVVIELDPARIALSLDIAKRGDRVGPWTIDEAPADAVIALNAGQFTFAGPWGWVRHNGIDRQPPGTGSVAGALVVDTLGQVAILPASTVAAARDDRRWREAVQSYPQLLVRGLPVPELCEGESLDLEHRDGRLVVGVRADGKVLLMLSRYAGLGSGVAAAAERLPIGPTTPEMAEIARRLGAVDALMLDGGLSAQLLLRDAGVVRRWPGMRVVPLALIGRRR